MRAPITFNVGSPTRNEHIRSHSVRTAVGPGRSAPFFSAGWRARNDAQIYADAVPTIHSNIQLFANESDHLMIPRTKSRPGFYPESLSVDHGPNRPQSCDWFKAWHPNHALTAKDR